MSCLIVITAYSINVENKHNEKHVCALSTCQIKTFKLILILEFSHVTLFIAVCSVKRRPNYQTVNKMGVCSTRRREFGVHFFACFALCLFVCRVHAANIGME